MYRQVDLRLPCVIASIKAAAVTDARQNMFSRSLKRSKKPIDGAFLYLFRPLKGKKVGRSVNLMRRDPLDMKRYGWQKKRNFILSFPIVPRINWLLYVGSLFRLCKLSFRSLFLLSYLSLFLSLFSAASLYLSRNVKRSLSSLKLR